MPTSTSKKAIFSQYGFNPGLYTTISRTIGLSGNLFTVSAKKSGSFIFDIKISGVVGNWSNFSGDPAFDTTDTPGYSARLMSSTIPNILPTAQLIAGILGNYEVASISDVIYNDNIVHGNLAGVGTAYIKDSQFDTTGFFSGVFRRRQPASVSGSQALTNPYEIMGFTVSETSDFDYIDMVNIVRSGGSNGEMFFKVNGNQYKDFFSTYNLLDGLYMPSNSISDNTVVDLAAALGITPTSIVTSPISTFVPRAFRQATSVFSTITIGSGFRLDAINF